MVKVCESEWTDYLLHPFGPRPVLHSVHQRFRHHGVVDKINKTESRRSLSVAFIHLPVDNPGNAPCRLAVAVSHEICGIAKFKRRVHPR